MKKLILFLIIVLSISVQAQVSTQKVNNTAVIYATNSVLVIQGSIIGNGAGLTNITANDPTKVLIMNGTSTNLTGRGTNTFDAVRWTNGVVASVELGFLQFKDELAGAVGDYKFYSDNIRNIGLIKSSGVPSIVASLGGNPFRIEADNKIHLSPNSPDGSILWTPNAVGGILELYYVGNISYIQSTGQRTLQFNQANTTVEGWVFNNTALTNSANTFRITAGAQDRFVINQGVMTLMSLASDTYILNGGTMAIPNGLNIGSGQLNIPSAGNITTIGNPIMACIVTNVMADFPNILAAGNADLSYIVAGAVTNMPCILGHPAAEDPALAVNALVVSNGTVTIRARNVGSLAVNQGDLPYRIQVVATPQ